MDQINGPLSLSACAVYVCEALTGSTRHCVDRNALVGTCVPCPLTALWIFLQFPFLLQSSRLLARDKSQLVYYSSSKPKVLGSNP